MVMNMMNIQAGQMTMKAWLNVCGVATVLL